MLLTLTTQWKRMRRWVHQGDRRGVSVSAWARSLWLWRSGVWKGQHTGIAIATSLSVSVVLVGLRSLGMLESLELKVYDRFVQLRSDLPSDPRLVVVGIAESDIRQQGEWPLSDAALAQLLHQIQKGDPAVVGLDLYRDVYYHGRHDAQRGGYAALARELQRPNLIAIRNIDDQQGTPAPRSLRDDPDAGDRLAFNDVALDADGVIRRNLLMAESPQGEFLFSLALRLALQYLAPQGITLENHPVDPNLARLGATDLIPLDRHAGAYQDLDHRGYQILLSYRSPRPAAAQFTITEVMLGQVNPRQFAGKVVLIGATAESVRDVFLTPYSSAIARSDSKMPGVVLHAQMVSQLLDAAMGDRPLLRYWQDWQEVGWIVLWALIGGSAAWSFHRPLVLIIFGGGIVASLTACCWLLFLDGTWVPVVAPILATTITGGIVVTYRAQEAQRQQQTVMRLLGQNTSPEVAKALWRDRDRLLKSGKLPGQKLMATVLFTDLRNFSTIAEQIPPEALFECLNEYLSEITHAVFSHGGTINKFTGDGLMALFGVPVARTDTAEIAQDARSAVDCALAMATALADLNQRWQQGDRPYLQMRVGIFTGPIVVGSLGGKERLEYGAIGDSVNIASRLESCEKERQPCDCRILIGATTAIHLDASYRLECWGPIALKGRRNTLDVYRAIAHPSATPAEPANLVDPIDPTG